MSDSYGGAISAYSGSTVSFNKNGAVTFSRNIVSSDKGIAYGGAIHLNSSTDILNITENDSVIFEDNASQYGGAIYSRGSQIFNGNHLIAFNENNAEIGGAIYGEETLAFADNESVVFSENQVTQCGGAIRGKTSFSENGVITFSHNSIESPDNSTSVYGGAICGGVTFDKNDTVKFSNNMVRAIGAQTSAYGGAIWGDSEDTQICGNNSVIICDNSVYSNSSEAYGGAIYLSYGNALTISGNESVLFQRNAEIIGSTYRLRSIYACQSSGSSSATTLDLSAAEGKSIIFRDGVYAGAGTTIKLNESGGGSIIFSGETTREDLNALLATEDISREATEDEIDNSLTSEMLGNTTLVGGELIIRDGAILNISHLSVENGNITIGKGAKLNLPETSISLPSLTLSGGTISLGSTEKHDAILTPELLTVTADSVLNADLKMCSGTLNFTACASVTLGCSVTLGENITLNLSDEQQRKAAMGELVLLFSSVEKLTVNNVTYMAAELAGSVSIKGFFSNYQNDDHLLIYGNDGSIWVTPEPATLTLVILSLVGGCLRRRR